VSWKRRHETPSCLFASSSLHLIVSIPRFFRRANELKRTARADSKFLTESQLCSIGCSLLRFRLTLHCLSVYVCAWVCGMRVAGVCICCKHSIHRMHSVNLTVREVDPKSARSVRECEEKERGGVEVGERQQTDCESFRFAYLFMTIRCRCWHLWSTRIKAESTFRK